MGDNHTLSPFKRQLAQTLIENDVSPQEVIKKIKYSRCTVFNYKENIRVYGEPLASSISQTGRPSILTVEMLDVNIFSCCTNHQILCL